MAAIFAIFIMIAGLTFLVFLSRKIGQRKFIEHYRFPPALRAKVKGKYPHLTEEQLNLVFDGLRDYFQLCHQAKKRMVSMPSQVVDVAWHEFILFTRAYKAFCQRGLGFFLHHTPAEAMKTPTVAQEGIKRAWRLACAKEKINPSTASYLPLLFAIDDLLQIEDGFRYRLNCMDPASPLYGSGYCAGISVALRAARGAVPAQMAALVPAAMPAAVGVVVAAVVVINVGLSAGEYRAG